MSGRAASGCVDVSRAFPVELCSCSGSSQRAGVALGSPPPCLNLALGLIFLLAMAGILFEDIFDVKDIDPEGKKFDRGGAQMQSRFFLPPPSPNYPSVLLVPLYPQQQPCEVGQASPC